MATTEERLLSMETAIGELQTMVSALQRDVVALQNVDETIRRGYLQGG